VYEDSKTKKRIEAFFRAPDAPADGPVLEVKERVTSQQQADELARRRLRLKNKNETVVNFRYAGDTGWYAGQVVELKTWGSFDGVYIVRQAKHAVVRNSGFKTNITLRKRLEGY
jgi:hypothetical protein